MKIKSALAVVLTGFAAYSAYAQGTYPTRPITIVVPYPAGGTSDVQVRIIQDSLGKLLGQPIIVDNKPGASGGIGAAAVARANPDGYTLLYPNNGILIAPLLNKKSPYDPIKDFAPISTVTSVPMVLVINKDVPANNFDEFRRYAKTQNEGLKYASAGAASYGHLATTRLAQVAGIKVTHIPYKGEAGTTMAVSSGEVEMLLTTPSSAMLGQVAKGNLKMMGVASERPSPVVPGVPTLNQTLPGFTSEVWFGLLAPAGTPDAIIEKINTAVKKLVTDDSLRAKLLPGGAIPKASTPAEFGALMKKEHQQWEEIIAKYHIKAD